MANVKRGNLTPAGEWWQHLRSFGKRAFWKGERRAQDKAIEEEVGHALHRRNRSMEPVVDPLGNTEWPDSDIIAPVYEPTPRRET
jgi:hypothetical protein